MPRRWSLFAVAVIALCASAAAARAAQTLTYPDLVSRMTDLQRLSVLPAAGERCAQASSYDRASKYDEKTGKYIDWGANGDGGGIIRKEGDRSVVAEIEGPGCIWRIWSAAPRQGRVAIYLDGQDTPAVDLPFENYFSGDTPPFNYPMLSYNLAKVGCQGQDLYMPIPFQKSCKVVADPNWGDYYHFTYATYPKDTKLPTFSNALVAEKENAAALQKVNDFFKDHLGQDPAGKREGEETLKKSVTVEPGETAVIAKLDGPRAITALRAKMSFADRKDQMAGLRKLALRITWDGQDKPAVWCPLGDFFGTAPGENLYKTLMTGMTKDGYYCNWYMPFGRSAVVELVNEDKVARTADFEVVHSPLGRDFDGLGNFHAKWHRDTFTLPKDRWPDWVMLRTQGKGRFCGVMLHVWNPRGGWWGEGDEKFFVDGEKFPSTFGTGSEDYFGYAWCDPHLFQKPYHAQTMTQNNKGHQSVLRWHIVDNVPFETGFEGCIEKYDHPGPGVRYANTAFWYLSPDGVDPYAPVAAADRDGYYDNPPIVVNGIRLIEANGGSVESQDLSGYPTGKWLNKKQIWWTGAKPGDKLKLSFPVKSEGKQQVSLSLTMARDYGIVQFYLDGEKVGQPVDLFNDPDVVSTTVALGEHELTAGDHTLTVEIVGANDKAVKSYMFGIASVTCEPVKP
ncbi:MAG: glycoside hydrolase family 172 protein [Thermoguttaceae bacterium]